VSNVQLDDNIRIWLLEEEGFKSAPETWKCRRRNNVFGQSIPDPKSRNVEGPTTDSRQSEHRTTRRLELAERSARRPCRSATRSSGPRYRGAASCRTLYVSTAILYCMLNSCLMLDYVTVFSVCKVSLQSFDITPPKSFLSIIIIICAHYKFSSSSSCSTDVWKVSAFWMLLSSKES